MRKTLLFFYVSFAVIMLIGCADHQDEDHTTHSSTEIEAESPSMNEVSKTSTNDATSNSTGDSSSNDEGTQTFEETEELTEYTSEQIEYARVWAQFGPNPEVDGLYVQHIPAGSPLNPDEEISLTYTEDVIQISGSRLVDGSITYSGNGDGTINIYNVPMRWYGGMPRPEDLTDEDLIAQMEEMIENTELEYIEPTDGEEIIELIEKLHIVEQ